MFYVVKTPQRSRRMYNLFVLIINSHLLYRFVNNDNIKLKIIKMLLRFVFVNVIAYYFKHKHIFFLYKVHTSNPLKMYSKTILEHSTDYMIFRYEVIV